MHAEGGESPDTVSELSHNGNAVIQEKPPKRPGRRSTLRRPIMDLLREHPEGLTAVQMKVHLGVDKNIGDTLSGMVRDGLLAKQGSGSAVRYRVRNRLRPQGRSFNTTTTSSVAGAVRFQAGLLPLHRLDEPTDCCGFRYL